MTRNALFTISSPRRRASGMAALLATAVLSGSFGIATVRQASAQSLEDPANIRQVAGRSGGVLSGLFGGSSSRDSSSKPKEPYRKATPVPSDRDVNWDGIPYHSPAGGRSASSQPIPIRDPGTRSRQLSQPSRTPAATVDASPRSRTPVPTPPSIARTTPRKLSISDNSPAAADELAGRSSEPLSTTQSSRRAVARVEPSSAQPTRLESKRPTLVEKSTPPSTHNNEMRVELVPKVNRRVLASAPPAASAGATKPAAAGTKEAASPAQETVVQSEGTSSRRVQQSLDAMPQKIESSKTEFAEVARREINKPAAVEQSAPATKTRPTPAAEVAATNAAAQSEVASQRDAARQTAQSDAIAALTTPEAAEQPKLAQSNSDTANAPASLGIPSASSQQTASAASGMGLPADAALHSASSRKKPAGPAELAAQSKSNGMNPLGDEPQAGKRSSGSLAAAGSAGIALHPISDRLPVEGQHQATDALQGQDESQAMSQDDAFMARSPFASGPTVPNYRAAGHGQASLGAAAAASSDQLTSPRDDADAPATTQHKQADTATKAASQPAAMDVAAQMNSNTTTTEMPVIRITTAGPRQVMIRQTHSYEIRVENRGSVHAEGLIVRAHIPDWADLVGQQVSRGDVQATTQEEVRKLNWQIDRLAAGETEVMSVRLKASRSGTHDLDVDYTIAPQKRVVQVTVQEPQLALTIDGPDEVIFGQSKTYQIRVLNSGDGTAPAVVFTLSPESSSPQSQRIGDIPAGKEAQFEVELTAQDLGELKIHGRAVGDLELKADADKTVRVLAADLEAVLSGPEQRYQDATALYQLELANHGTTASEDVVATLTLPMGVTYQGGMEGASVTDNQLRWKVASLPPGAVRKYQFECHMDATGTHQFEFECKGSAAGQASVSLDTKVDAIADLKLSVVDPVAPAPIGEDVNYQIIIRNRGSKPAFDVQAIAQFSHGIEPKQLSGHMGKVVTGQVLIDPIASIEAGQEVRMTIVARAETGGNHRFRTEIRSGETVLVAEEATYYIAPKNDRITRRSGPSSNEPAAPLR